MSDPVIMAYLILLPALVTVYVVAFLGWYIFRWPCEMTDKWGKW